MDTGHKQEKRRDETVRTNHATRLCLACGSTFAVAVELLLLPTQLVVELAVVLHLQHLGEHQVTGGVATFVRQEVGPERRRGPGQERH